MEDRVSHFNQNIDGIVTQAENDIMKSGGIAIVVVAYNRSDSVRRLLGSLLKANYSQSATLIISVDKSDTDEVGHLADEFVWPYGEKRVVKHSENLGLRKHILGIGDYLNKYDAIIVLEDDLIVSSNFFIYAKQAIDYYYEDERVAGISLYSFAINYQTFYPFIPQHSDYDTYFIQCAQSWGQIWMKNQWSDFKEWYEKHENDGFDSRFLPHAICSWSSKSWLKYHTRYCIEMNRYFVYPYFSLTSNCGESGTHLKYASPVFQRVLDENSPTHKYVFPELNNEAVKYDGFFEAERIYNVLGMSKDELCLDLTNSKFFYEVKPFLLSTRRLGYKVVEEYGLSYSPIEMNVLNKAPGNLIFLYDTRISGIPPKHTPPVVLRQLFAYMNHVDIFAVIRRVWRYGIISLCKTVLNAIK